MTSKALKGYSVSKDGKVTKRRRGLDTSAKIRQRKSKKVRVIPAMSALAIWKRS